MVLNCPEQSWLNIIDCVCISFTSVLLEEVSPAFMLALVLLNGSHSVALSGFELCVNQAVLKVTEINLPLPLLPEFWG